MRRIHLIAAMVSVLAASAAAEARIGETEAQLVQRFGAVTARSAERTLEQGRAYVLGERIVLRQAEWRVTAVLIGGICAKITYVRSGRWSERHFADLLALNSGRWSWAEVRGGAPNWQRTWRRSDGLVAKWMYAGGLAIEAQPFVDAQQRVRDENRRGSLSRIK